MAKLVDLTGKKFGRLAVLHRALGIAHRDRFHNAMWKCRCECGKTCIIAGSNIRNGDTSSCGCLRIEAQKLAFRIHGMTKTPEHNTWTRMIQRCHNPKSSSYRRYGGRGIEVCAKWRNDFMAFFADMGKHPGENFSIERIDNEKGYGPGNCKWATVKEQARNRRNIFIIEHDGEKLCLLDWAARLGVSRAVIYNRIESGLSPSDAIKSIANQNGPLVGGPKIGSGLIITFAGKSLTVAQWCDELGRTKAAIYSKIRRGRAPEAVIESMIRANERKALLYGHRYIGK